MPTQTHKFCFSKCHSGVHMHGQYVINAHYLQGDNDYSRAISRLKDFAFSVWTEFMLPPPANHGTPPAHGQIMPTAPSRSDVTGACVDLLLDLLVRSSDPTGLIRLAYTLLCQPIGPYLHCTRHSYHNPLLRCQASRGSDP